MLVQGRKWCKERRFRQGIVYFIPYSEEKALKERQTKPWTLMQENTLWNPTLTTHVYACFSLLYPFIRPLTCSYPFYDWQILPVSLLSLDTGFFCGEIDMPKTYISESPHVKVVFHVDSFSEQTYFQFYVTAESAVEYHQRIGQGFHSSLHSNRRGSQVANTVCDRVFENCSPGHCYIQSPGFPEVYPRNLRCR